MKSDTKILLQLAEMIDNGHVVSFDGGLGCAYECTFYYWSKVDNTNTHGRFGGNTLAESVNRTYQFYLTLKDNS